ncbi:MAG: 4-hydroxy-3-methylbut-2-enyl diphosphate reductase [Planctomycetes bacterium]|nr:4-hydroxy-3-methylbut-2-enyl diphosphate reductase [Planctomycetota bacterium]
MKVILASHYGMCFGVRDALAIASNVPTPHRFTIHGQLVHNPQINEGLARRGFSITPENRRDPVPLTPGVLITAHGISSRERSRLLRAKKTLIDTTCPLVRRVHNAAQRLNARGFFVIVIGKRSHVEVQGIVGDLDRYAVVEKPHDVQPYDAEALGVVCQTTTPPFLAEEVIHAIRACNPGKSIEVVDTICLPTRQRQEAVLALLNRVQALVVVGGRNSNNSRQLARLAEDRNIPCVQVERDGDLDPEWFKPFSLVGLTAGTSTPDAAIRAVHRALLRLTGAQGTTEVRPLDVPDASRVSDGGGLLAWMSPSTHRL